jgi:hypothetical protein
MWVTENKIHLSQRKMLPRSITKTGDHTPCALSLAPHFTLQLLFEQRGKFAIYYMAFLDQWHNAQVSNTEFRLLYNITLKKKVLSPANYISHKLSTYYIPQFHFSLQQN